MELDLDLDMGTLVTLALGALVGGFVVWLMHLLFSRRREEEYEDYYQKEAVGVSTGKADPFEQGRYLERRNAARRGGNPVVVMITDEAAQAEPIRGYVLDRSVGGICVSCEAEIESGTILSMRAANAPDMVPWVQAEVKNCRQNGREWEIGCQWVRTPPWSVLLLFG